MDQLIASIEKNTSLLAPLTSIEKNTRPLPQIPLEVKYKTNNYRMDLVDTIDLSDGNYVMGVTSFNTYNSIFNITSKNNKLIYFDGVVWKEIVLQIGAYEITQINDEIYRQLAIEYNLTNETESPIILEPNRATLGSIIRLEDGFKNDFTKTNTL